MSDLNPAGGAFLTLFGSSSQRGENECRPSAMLPQFSSHASSAGLCFLHKCKLAAALRAWLTPERAGDALIHQQDSHIPAWEGSALPLQLISILLTAWPLGADGNMKAALAPPHGQRRHEVGRGGVCVCVYACVSARVRACVCGGGCL